ncbi:phospholipase D-like domain-containing protein [Saccharolobus caldissimus]|uniref:PLD phosphodiesterase domain-containing protein n=1 Tax=Saccharolobus caldissimus TaxID=1702097 RepID=A0AAQ4CUZ1_9CREN|nr:phospholipase D-like domain-containing protein [Saccharolobus caldissimus]BDB99622.1 hypothetical protein SACC_26390 [Saccharolobus caldissimus]
MSEYSGTKRSGIQALYTFTPFKLLFGKNGYGLVLVPILYYKNRNTIDWKKGIADNFNVPYYRRDFEVIRPNEIKPYVFTPNSKNSVEYMHHLLSNSSHYIDMNDAASPFPLIAKYSYSSLINGYYCKYGLILLHDSKECPLASRCKLFKPKKGRDCEYYNGPMPYERLYTVFPHIVRRIREGGIDNKKRILTLIVVKIGNSDRILGKIEFSDKLNLEAFSDATIFYAKAADLMYKDFLWTSYEKGIGFRLNNLNGLIFKFNDSALNDYISFLIKSNQEIEDWLCAKMFIYFGNRNRIYLRKFSLSQNGFNAMNRFEKLIDEIISNKAKAICNRDNLILFGSFILVHTLAHVIINIGTSMVNQAISADYTYYIEHPIFGDVSTSVYVVESIYGGFGYLKTLSTMINRGDQILRKILDNLTQMYNDHEKRFNSSLSNLNGIINNFIGRLDNNLLRRTLEIFQDWVNGPFPRTFPYHFVIRNYLGERYSSVINRDGDTRQAFKDMIAALPLCWDGCNMCVGMDKGCMFGPYDQPFLISRKIVSELIKTHIDWLGRNTFSFTTNLYNVFKDLINLAENEIKIISPWISKEIINELKKVKKEKDLRITIICLDDKSNSEAITEAEENEMRVVKIPSISEQGIIHSKIMIIDDAIALTGSANFTINGLTKNIETEMVIIDPSEMVKLTEQFNKIIMNYESNK